MALPLPEGKKIHINYRLLEPEFEMPSLEAAPDHYTLCLIIRGDRRVITPTMTYELHSGDVNAMPPFLYHKTMPASDEYYENILIKFSPDILDEFSRRLGNNIIDRFFESPPKSFEDEKARERVFSTAWNMWRIYDAGDTNETYLNFRLQSLLYGLILEINSESSHVKGVNNHQTVLSQPIMDAIYYIEKNYMKQIHIEDAAFAGGYSVSYFSRLFQSQLGLSFTDYLQSIRLKHVKSDLISTDRSIMDIAIDNGFIYAGNMSSCFRKKTGMTPTQFRRKIKEK